MLWMFLSILEFLCLEDNEAFDGLLQENTPIKFVLATNWFQWYESEDSYQIFIKICQFHVFWKYLSFFEHFGF